MLLVSTKNSIDETRTKPNSSIAKNSQHNSNFININENTGLNFLPSIHTANDKMITDSYDPMLVPSTNRKTAKLDTIQLNFKQSIDEFKDKKMFNENSFITAVNDRSPDIPSKDSLHIAIKNNNLRQVYRSVDLKD